MNSPKTMTQPSIDNTQITEAENNLRQAMKNGDVAKLDALLHDDLLFVLPNGEVITKQTDLDNYNSGFMKVDDIRSELELIRIIADTAVVTLTSTISGKMADQHFAGKFHYIRVWKVDQGRLKVVAGGCVGM